MGMYDTFRDSRGRGWQTKAYDCMLDLYSEGDRVPGASQTYQVKVLGESGDSYATIENGILSKVPDRRAPFLPLMGYFGEWEQD